jgi:phosphoadenosine phosphosulfate reductase
LALTDKIQDAINLLVKHEATALNLNPDGYYVAFSGGKDSQVIYELCKMSGVKFNAHFSMTTVDPPELLSFIKIHYKDVAMHRPEKSIFQLIKINRSLPLKQIPFCCRLIKEIHGVNSLVINGVRKQESHRRKDKEATVNHVCIMGQDKLILSLIANWTHSDVWNFIHQHIGYYCELYDQGFNRIGCLFCPNATPKEKQSQLRRYPRFRYAYEKAIQACIDYGNYKEFNGASDVFDWWISGKPKRKWIADRNQGSFEM